MKKPVFLALALGALLCAFTVSAQLPVSRRAGIQSVPIAGNGAFTPVGVPFTQEPVARDIVDGVSGNIITSGAGGYTPGAFAPVGSATSHILLLVTGPNRGRGLAIANNTATDITLAEAPPALTVGSDEFEIIPLPTLASAFGAPPHSLNGSSGAAGADKVVIGSTQYFYKTSGAASPGWKVTTSPNGGNVSNAPIPNLAGVGVIRFAGAPATNATVTGVARSTRAVIPISAGVSRVSWPFTGNVTLGSSGLQNTLTGASGAAGADKVLIGATQYFYKTSGAAAPGWKTTTAPNGSNMTSTVLNPNGAAFILIRPTNATVTSHPVLESFTP